MQEIQDAQKNIIFGRKLPKITKKSSKMTISSNLSHTPTNHSKTVLKHFSGQKEVEMCIFLFEIGAENVEIEHF